MSFIPDTPKTNQTIKYYDDVEASEGWQGQTTTKSIETLKSEIVTAISRLGGIVSGFVKGIDQRTVDGKIVACEGYRIHYSVETSAGKFIPGQIDIIALPVRHEERLRRSFETRKLGALKMALYMFRQAMEGLWFMEQLSPGYSGLMPFMLADGKKTVSQLFTEGMRIDNLLPSGDANSIEGYFKEIK